MPQSAPGPTFGALLKTLRVRSGYTQENLAERAGLSAKAIGALEQGSRRAPYPDNLGRLMAALELSAEDRAMLQHAASQVRRPRGSPPATDARPAQAVFPVALTSFIDRPEVDDIACLIENHRLVTITGAGGIGKTRTAGAVATRSAGRRDVRFVDFSLRSDDDSVIAALAQSFAQSSSVAMTIDDLGRSLSGTDALAIFDNCEHLLEPITSVAGALLQRCPGLTILATSREHLAVPGEIVYRLPSLRISQSVELFMSRARAVDMNETVPLDRTDLIAEICRRLDGIPLAIEIAAVQLPAFGLATLAARIADTFRYSLGRGRPARQQTMDAAIAWSYDLLSRPEQHVFAYSSVFSGGFTIRAAEHVCTQADLDAGTVAASLAQLVRKSLVDVRTQGDGLRYYLLEPIAAYASRKLDESALRSEAEHRHARWLADYAEEFEAATSPVPAFFAESDNARAAIRRYAAGSESDMLLVARILGGFRSHFANGPQHDAFFTATALDVFLRLGDGTRPFVSLRLAWLILSSREAFDRRTRADVLSQAMRIAAGMGDDAAQLKTCYKSAVHALERGWNDLAEESLVLGDAVYERGAVGDPAVIALYLSSRAWIRSVQGRFDEARADVERLFAHSAQSGQAEEHAMGLFALAEIECAEGRHSVAIRCIRSAIESDTLRYESRMTALTNLACYLALTGDAIEAERCAREVLAAGAAAAAIGRGTVIQHLATALALAGDPHFAARLMGFVDETSRRSRNPRLGTEHLGYHALCAALAQRLSPNEIASAAAAGATLSSADAIAEIFASPPLDGACVADAGAHETRGPTPSLTS